MRPTDLIDRGLRWLTEGPKRLRSFSVLRIIYGVAFLFLLVPSVSDRSLLWGPASFWVDPEASRRGFITFDTVLSKSSAFWFDVAHFGMIALVIVFILGYRTRIVLPVLLLMYLALQANNPYVLNGGDTLMRVTMAFMLFSDLSAHYSLDALRRRKRAERAGGVQRRLVPPYVAHAAHNVGLVLCCFQIIVVYVTSGVWKLTGSEWLEGTAIFYALRLDTFITYPLVNEMLWQSSLLIYIATFVALWVQTLFPLGLLWRPTRIFVLITLMLMHLGIAVLMGLWPFSLAMIALDMLFIRDSTWESMRRWLGRTRMWSVAEARMRDAIPRYRRAVPPNRASRKTIAPKTPS